MNDNDLEMATSLTLDRVQGELLQWGIPEYMHDGWLLYLSDGVEPGSFLTAVLQNNLVEAASLADENNILHLKDYAGIPYNEMPRGSWGSVDKFNDWVSHNGWSGIAGEKKNGETEGA